MFKLCVLFAIVAAVYGAPAPAPGYLAAPALAALPSPLVTASSSQYIARNYNNLAALPIAYAASPVAYATHAIAPAYTAYAAPALVSIMRYHFPHTVDPVSSERSLQPDLGVMSENFKAKLAYFFSSSSSPSLSRDQVGTVGEKRGARLGSGNNLEDCHVLPTRYSDAWSGLSCKAFRRASIASIDDDDNDDDDNDDDDNDDDDDRATSSTVRCLNDAEYRNSMRMARGSGCKEDPRESSYIREPRLVFSGITLLPPISSYARINKMFKLFLFAALLAFAAAAPAPAPGAILSAPLVTSYAGAPIVSSLGTPVAYSAYSAPLAYNTYASPYSYVPYAYKAGYYI
uniref:Uncharacterized protein n=2 Tax=Vespula TaxID=7451 RepID=A0A834U3U8_VESPE|nr:hypothetical protein H0235_012028 [Vespula pensylvanica]